MGHGTDQHLARHKPSPVNPTGTLAPPPPQLTFHVARSVEEVLAAWGLVYSSYQRRGLIASNPFNIHTTPQAVGPQTTVIAGRLDRQPVCTISTICDSAVGLPLDLVYKPQIDNLRQRGMKPLEIGLFADRREDLGRSLHVLIELMRHVFHVGVTLGFEHAVVGVHPRHVRFYQRYFAFDLLGQPTLYPTVCNNPVVPLWLDLRAKLQSRPVPAGLEYLRSASLSPALLDDRYAFDPQTVAASPLGAYLAYHARHAAAAGQTQVQSA